jgi:hypothetical protein
MVEGRVHTRNTLDRSGGSSADGTVSRVTSTFELSKHGLRASARYALRWRAPLQGPLPWPHRNRDHLASGAVRRVHSFLPLQRLLVAGVDQGDFARWVQLGAVRAHRPGFIFALHPPQPRFDWFFALYFQALHQCGPILRMCWIWQPDGVDRHVEDASCFRRHLAVRDIEHLVLRQRVVQCLNELNGDMK